MKYRISTTLILLLMTITSFQAWAAQVTRSGFAFLTTTPEIHYQVTVNRKTIISASLVVVDVGGVAPAGYEVVTAELISQQDNPLNFTFSKPNNGWPAGDYEIIVKDNDNVIHTASLSVFSSSNAAAAPSSTSAARSANRSGVLAQGQGGQLTAGAANAYVDALVFVLAQLGQPRDFSAQERQTIVNNLASHYSSFPFETQQDLASAKQILSEYRQQWSYLGIDEQKEFAYSVLAIAYGEQAAAQALGINNGGGSGGGSGSSYYSNGSSYVSDGKCAIFSSEYGSVSSCD